MSRLLAQPLLFYQDANGKPLPGALCHVYLSGTNTPFVVFQDGDLTIPHANPIVALTDGYFPAIYGPPGVDLKLILTDEDGGRPKTIDPASLFVLTQAEVGAALYPLTAAEDGAGITPVDYSYPPYHLLRHGADSSGTRANDTAFADWRAACDAANAEGIIPEGTYLITADITLPLKVLCKGGSIKGAFNVKYTARQRGYVRGITCQKFVISGCILCDVDDLVANTSVNVDGLDSGHGTFWNNFRNWETPSCTITTTNFAVNMNAWYGGIIRYLHITGNTSLFGSGAQASNNVWDSVDFSNNSLTNFGVVQDDEINYSNTLRNCYFENGSGIKGNFHVIGWFGEANFPPRVDRFRHIIGTTSINQRTSRDYFSLQVHNMARGGQWDWLDYLGKPPSFTAIGGGGSVVTDTTEPNGVGKAYRKTCSSAFDGFQIVAEPNNTDRIAFVVFYKNSVVNQSGSPPLPTGDFFSADINGTVVTPLPVVVDSVNNWRMIRVAGTANKTTQSTLTLNVQGASPSGSPIISIGAVFAGQEGGILCPNRNDEFFSDVDTSIGGVTNNLRFAVGQFVQQQGGIVVTSAATNPRDVTVTFPWAFAVQPNINVDIEDDGSGNAANVTSRYILSRSTTQFVYRINHTGNFSGTLHWRAGGNRA